MRPPLPGEQGRPQLEQDAHGAEQVDSRVGAPLQVRGRVAVQGAGRVNRARFLWLWSFKVLRRIRRLRRMWWALGEDLKHCTELKVPVPVRPVRRQARQCS